ncbi:hypothetical protein JOC78_001384 [Bacillus ectoiniformans]|uniref:nuclease-related domain-containing protein n=1 Tax=Bacillus ectoiniformans TaxID=1494429 RepID=UPI001EF8EA98|nr:nuclease-related domain-containing protein [Bacillus ectoiniformans]MBM7648442.1 hypothetical protein [Bacillus ectoiniformans]
MARIISNKNHLETDIKKLNGAKRRGSISILGLTIGAFILHLSILPLIGPIICFALMTIPARKNKQLVKEIQILRSGLKGEKQALEFFKQLPEDYTVFSDLEIIAEGKKSQLDNVIVGPNGIFVIETKNLNGEIQGNSDDTQLTQYKIGRKGNPYNKTFYNPIKQVSTHVYRLSRLLKSNGVDTWIQGAVYFANPDCSVMVHNDSDIPVFSHSDNRHMLQYILSYQGKKKVSLQDKEKLEQLLIS